VPTTRTRSIRAVRSASSIRSNRPARERSVAWRDAAACREEDPDLFFPVSSQGPGRLQEQRAKEVCARCPVSRECLAWALAHEQVAGVWGGLTEEERRAHRGSRTARSGTTGTSEAAPAPPRPRRSGSRSPGAA